MSVNLCQGGAGDTPMFPEDRSLLLSHLHIPPNASFWFPDGALAGGEGGLNRTPTRTHYVLSWAHSIILLFHYKYHIFPGSKLQTSW